MKRTRLDALLAERGTYSSRTRAAAAVIAGQVCIGPERRRATKPGQMVDSDVELSVDAAPEYVSRGGIKLANALGTLSIDPVDRVCMDVGASTGGFTDCLLQRGARCVIALDVAYGELAWSLRQDERVHVLERTNARSLNPSQLPYRPELIVIDVAFISLTKILGAVVDCAAVHFDILAMVKPQFEVGKGRLGKGGVVRDPELRKETILNVGEFALGVGATICGAASSGLPGPAGNRETFLWLAEGDREEAIGLDALADRLDSLDP